jgi:hypothetical protein
VKAGSGKKLKALVFLLLFSPSFFSSFSSPCRQKTFSHVLGDVLSFRVVVDSLTKSHHLIVPLPCWEMNTLFTCSWKEDRIHLRLAH